MIDVINHDATGIQHLIACEPCVIISNQCRNVTHIIMMAAVLIVVVRRRETVIVAQLEKSLTEIQTLSLR